MVKKLLELTELVFDPVAGDRRTPQEAGETLDRLTNAFASYARSEDIAPKREGPMRMGGPWRKCNSTRWSFAQGVRVEYTFHASGLGSHDYNGELDGESLSMSYFEANEDYAGEIRELIAGVGFAPRE